MYYRIKDGNLYDYADYKYAEDCLETNIATKAELDSDKDKFKPQNGILVDVSNSAAYNQIKISKENAARQIELQTQIDELDKKRIRAIAEPALKDAQNGQTWLEYYTLQIQALRGEIAQMA